MRVEEFRNMSRNGLSPEVFGALRTLDGPTLSNAIETFHVRDRLTGYAGYRVRCLFPDLGVTLGYAVTAQVDRTSPYPPANKAPLHQLAELVEACPKPVVLVFQDIGPRPGYAASFGAFGVALMQRLGAVALVCDTAVKDLDRVRELGFQLFALGSVVSHGYPRIIRMGVPVVVDGLYVEPGDLIHGDANGVLSIPLQIADKVAAEARRLREVESETLRYVVSREFTLDGALKRMGF
jgi:4-hydroxy-4-methyl-2-oxoglutarate aldolase